MSRKKLPIQVKKIRGTLRKDRDGEVVKVTSDMVQLPSPPTYLRGEGRIYYEQQGTAYLQAGILNGFNLPLFLSICILMSRMQIYAKNLKRCKDLDDTLKYQRVYDDCQKNLRLTMAEFGLSPASIGRIHMPEKQKENKLSQFINNTQNKPNGNRR